MRAIAGRGRRTLSTGIGGLAGRGGSFADLTVVPVLLTTIDVFGVPVLCRTRIDLAGGKPASLAASGA